MSEQATAAFQLDAAAAEEFAAQPQEPVFTEGIVEPFVAADIELAGSTDPTPAPVAPSTFLDGSKIGRRLATAGTALTVAIFALKGAGASPEEPASASPRIPGSDNAGQIVGAKAAQARTETRRSKVSPTRVMDMVQKSLRSHTLDIPPTWPKPLRYKYKGQWRNGKKIYPTSAFLTSSSGGYKTACDNPFANSSYKNFEIYYYGKGAEPCGQNAVFPDKAKIGEFQGDVNRIGNYVMTKSSITPTGQATESVKATRKQVTADYECNVNELVAGPGVAERIKRIRATKTTKTTRSTITYC